MPQLPSGLRLAVDAALLDQLFADAQACLGGSIPELMAITQTADLAPYLRFMWLEPDLSPEVKSPTLLPYSAPLDGPVRSVLSGFRVADWDVFATTLSVEDKAATLDFLNSERHQRMRDDLLDEVQEMQKALLNHATPIVKIQALWARKGVHPLQTGESEQGMWEGAFDEALPPEDDVGGSESNEGVGAPPGHAIHWEAVGISGEAVLERVGHVLEEGTESPVFPPPWEGSQLEACGYHWSDGPDFVLFGIVGQPKGQEDWELDSGYPVALRTAPWRVSMHGLSRNYGACEGVIRGLAPDGHPLQWFAPWFIEEAEAWRQCVKAEGGTVKMAGIALSMKRYSADPVIINQDLAVENHRKEPLAVGHHTMRSLFSSREDHCEYVGKILFVDDVSVEGLPSGWWVQLECLPEDGSESTRSLPVFVFPPALIDGYIPKQGDLVSGVLWLQGSKPLPTELTLQ